MKTKLNMAVNKHLPKRDHRNNGYRVEFKAVDENKVKWVIRVTNDKPSNVRKAVAIKQGTKGKTPTTRIEFDYTKSDNGFTLKYQPKVVKL